MSGENTHARFNDLPADVATALFEALATVRAVGVDVVSAALSGAGDVHIESVEAEAVIVFVEILLGGSQLAEVADLGADQRTSLSSLGHLLASRRDVKIGARA